MRASYVVTGGAGFIGSHIVDALINRGEKVKVIDNLTTGNRHNLDNVIDKIEFIEGSITDLDLLQKEFKGAKYVLHQAALPSVPRSIADPIAANETNITGTLNVLIAARDNKIKRVVYAGSSSSYGNNNAPAKSEDLPPNPLSPYALTKYSAEVYCQLFYSLYKLETVTLRYFNVFGPRQNPNNQYAAVIPKFITSMLQGKSPVILGDGEQSRDFTYVGNNVEANLLAAKAKKGAGEMINIACGTSITLNQLVALINKELGSEITPEYQDARPGDVKHSKASIEKANKIIGYTPTVPFEKGLKETIAWYANQKQ